jgi:predicted aspartyl protease
MAVIWLAMLLGPVFPMAAVLFEHGTKAPATAPAQKFRQAPSPSKVIPFTIHENHIYVSVRVNGSRPLSFVLDTGATNHLLSQSKAEEVGISNKNTTELGNVGTGEGKIRIAAARNISLNIDGIELENQDVFIVPMDRLEAVAGHSIDGILGAELFLHFVVGIDYSTQTITLFDSADYSHAGPGQVIPLKLIGNRPFVRAKVAASGTREVGGLFVIDTGDSSALSLHTPFIAKNDLLPPSDKVISHFTNGLGGQSKELLGRAQKLVLGKFSIRQPVTAFSQATQGTTADSHYDGAIGGEILRRFKVTFDYSRSKMILEQESTFDDPFKADMSGLSLVAEGKDFGTIRVERVLEDSPAAEAGFSKGDVIMAIDGQPAAAVTLEKIKKLFEVDGREYTLSIRRAEQDLKLNLKLKPLI